MCTIGIMLLFHLRGFHALTAAVILQQERHIAIRSSVDHTASTFCRKSDLLRRCPIVRRQRYMELSSNPSFGADNNNANVGDSDSINCLPMAKPLNNDFFALRHGQSEANCLGIIASDPEIACQTYGLSETGQQQARRAGQVIVQHFLEHNGSGNGYNGLALISSDLLRCRETASLVLEEITNSRMDIPLHADGAIVFDQRLRERSFGDLDGTSDQNYAKVWEVDAVDASARPFRAESVDSVTRRATALVREYDARLCNYMVVLTAHGDVLQILQTAFGSLPGTRHRTIPHLETATLRRLELTVKTK